MRKRLLQDVGFALAIHAIVSIVCLPLVEGRAAAAPPEVPPDVEAPALPAPVSVDDSLAALWTTVWGVPYVPGRSGMAVMADLGGGAWLVHALLADESSTGGAVVGVGFLEETWRDAIAVGETIVEQDVEVIGSFFESFGTLSGPAGTAAPTTFLVVRAQTTDGDGPPITVDGLVPAVAVAGSPVGQVGDAPPDAPSDPFGTGWWPSQSCSASTAGVDCAAAWDRCRECCSLAHASRLRAIGRMVLVCAAVAFVVCLNVSALAYPLCLLINVAVCTILAAAAYGWSALMQWLCRSGCDAQRMACQPGWTPPGPPTQ